MSVILGLNTLHAGSSAALIIDGKTVFAIAEERLNRIKYYAGFPKLSVQSCLDYGGVTFSDIDYVTVGRDSSANLAKKVEYVMKNPTKLLNLLSIKKSRSHLEDLKHMISRECKVDESKLRFQQHNVEHHIAHIASAYYLSGWDHAAGFSIDGSGDFVTVMMAECSGNKIDVKHRIYVPHSLGSLYTMICEFIGYDKYGDEGKVMGLAPYGENTYKDVFDDMINLKDDGIRLNSKYFMPFGASQGLQINKKGQVVLARHYTDYIVEKFGEPRKRHSEITQRDMDLAFGLQQKFEEAYIHLLNILNKLVPDEKLVMAGGCVLNSVANGKIFDETPFKKTFIHPAAGDEGLSLGAALYVNHAVLNESNRSVMVDAYLGPEYTDDEIAAELDRGGVSHEKCDRSTLIANTVDEMEKGNIAGWFQGRMEWGPRALGNRSILAHPGLPNMKDVLNSRIKHRESFRPFAPSILEEAQSEIFERGHPSPFMLHVYKIKPEWRDRLNAVNHIDNTGRLQSVRRDENPLYCDLIEAFRERTGIPIVLNTSFNENEPIVCNPREAIECFMRTKMDVLAIGPYFCRKQP